MAKITKGMKYRIYPNEAQKAFFEKHFGCTRFVHNHFLDYRKRKYKEEGLRLTGLACKRLLVLLKKEYPWLKDCNSQSLQEAVLNLDLGFKRFFKGLAHYPKFKKKFGKQSFSVPQHTKIENKKLTIPKMKKGIKVKWHRKLNGSLKGLSLSKSPCGKYYVSFTVESQKKPLPIKKSKIGIDLGLSSFLTTSKGEKTEYDRYLRKHEKRLVKRQRELSRKQKGSENRNKARIRVARLHEKISNQRKDFLHQTSRKIINENQVIYLEDLNVKGMMKQHRLAKSIGDSGWGEFVRQLTYKADWYGREVVFINRYFPSSKTCSSCGQMKESLKLSDRIWICDGCKTEHDRDVNAAKNILNVGLDGSYLKPVERMTSVGSRKRLRKPTSLKQEPHASY